MKVEKYEMDLHCSNKACCGWLTLTGFNIGPNYANFRLRCVECGAKYSAPHQLVDYFYDSDWYKKQDKCYRCARVANHIEYGENGKRLLCCKHYVEEGGLPANWHSGCMTAYKQG